MYGRLSIVTPPVGYPVTTTLVKQHTRIDNSDDDTLLSVYIGSATAMVEHFLNRALLTQTLLWSLANSFPVNSWPLVPAPVLILPLAMEWSFQQMLRRDIELPRPPLQSVSLVTYAQWGDTSDTTLTAGTQYDVDNTCDPSRVHLHSDVPWGTRSHTSVTYQAGYGAAADVPVPIIHAILLTVANMYEHRGNQDTGDLPEAARSLLWNYRIYGFA